MNDVSISPASRETIGAMKRWIDLGSGELREAQQRLGLTNRDRVLALGASEHTWRHRWKKTGKVPAGNVQDVARVLNLEVEEPEPVPVEPRPDDWRQVAERLDDVEAVLRELVRRLTDAEPPEANPGAPPAN